MVAVVFLPALETLQKSVRKYQPLCERHACEHRISFQQQVYTFTRQEIFDTLNGSV
jgi:hypothetical protein